MKSECDALFHYYAEKLHVANRTAVGKGKMYISKSAQLLLWSFKKN